MNANRNNWESGEAHEPTQVIAARWIFPIVQAPIHGGWVRVMGDRIVEVGQGRPPISANDLGDVALLPALVNAHTHLEFSDCEKPIGQPGTLLSDWIGQVISARAATTAEQKVTAIRRGIDESRQAGVGLIGEIATPPAVYPAETGDPEICALAEVLGLSRQRSDERLDSAISLISQQPAAGVSPHAPYSTRRGAIQSCVDLAVLYGRTLAMHVAESPAERELLQHGTGSFAAALQALGVFNDKLFPWSSDPIRDLIHQLSAAPRVLLVHGNDLTDEEIHTVVQHPNMSVVYCPRTHAFFQYDKHPVDRLLAAGAGVALGTDSRASNPDLDLWREVQYLLHHRQDIDPDQVIAMATIHGAEAFGRSDLGRLTAGSCAAMAVVPTAASTLANVYSDFAQASAGEISR